MFQQNLFFQRVKELRLEKGVTQKQVGIAAGVKKQSVTSWEVGARLPSVPVLYALADYFDVSTDYLLGRSDSRKQV